MTNISKTPVGELDQFRQNLHGAGLTYEDIQEINKKPGLARKMVETLRPKPEPTWRLPSWYVMPFIRLEWARQANIEHGWGFAESDFPAIPGDLTKFWLLDIKLPAKGKKTGLQRTIDEFYELIDVPRGYEKQHARGFLTDTKHLRLAPGNKYWRGMRWVELDLDAYPDMSSAEALTLSRLDGVKLLGAEALAGVWQFPEWISSWEALTLSGLQARTSDDDDWNAVPILCRWSGSHTFGLMAPKALRRSHEVSASLKLK